MSKTKITEEVFELIKNETDISKNHVSAVVGAVFPAIMKIVKEAGKCRIPTFGTYTLTDRSERVCSHPQTGEKITIPACKGVKFSAGDKFKESVQD